MKRIISLLVVSVGLIACNRAAAPPTPDIHVLGFCGRRELSVTIPGSGQSSFTPAVSENDGAVITTAKHRIVIDQQCVMIDGVEFVKLPAESRCVEIWLNREGQFSMNTDGKGFPTLSKQLSK